MFNYYKSSTSEDGESNIFQVDGVYEKSYLEKLNIIKDISQIQSATTSKFALFGISQECIKEESYFSIYTSSNKITTIAVHKNEILYSRTNTIVARNAELRIYNMVAEINQTINYVKGQFRDIKFSTIAFSGTIAIDDTIAEHLYLSISDTNITILYPNTFIKGMEGADVQTCIIALGTLFVPKKFQFLPDFIFAIKQYRQISKVILAASFLPVLAIGFFAVEKYISYSDTFQKYKTLKERFVRKAKEIKTYSIEELERNLNYLQIVQRHLEHSPIDFIATLKPLLELEKAQSFDWKQAQNGVELKTTFKRDFDTFEALYEFEKEFYAAYEDLNTTLKRNYLKQTDYKQLNFASTIILDNKKEAPKAPPQRKRRR